MLRKIRLNGELGKKFGRVHSLDVHTPAEAIRALCALFPNFRHEVTESEKRGIGYRCVVDDTVVTASEIGFPISKTFKISPVVAGAGKFGQIIIGAALIAAAFYFAPLTLAGAGTMNATLVANMGATAFLGLTYANIAWLGVAMVLGGVSQLLAPTPKMPDKIEKKENPYFDGPVNTTAQGAAIPVGYGRMIVGSAVIGAAVTVEQKVYPTLAYDYPIWGY